jgi:hypothetical protein
MTTYLDWTPIVRSFIHTVTSKGFTLTDACDGEETIKTNNRKDAAEHVCACDEGNLYFEKDGYRFRAYIVLGNEPCETVCDYGWNNNCPQSIVDEFDSACDEFSERWEDRKCPTVER